MFHHIMNEESADHPLLFRRGMLAAACCVTVFLAALCCVLQTSPAEARIRSALPTASATPAPSRAPSPQPVVLLEDKAPSGASAPTPAPRVLPILPAATPPLPAPRPTPKVEMKVTSYRDYMFSHGSHDIAITIDDGPSENTPALLAVLREEGARATFFVLGNRVRLYPQYAREIVAQGSEIANHSWSHFALQPGESSGRGIREFLYAQQVIGEATGVSGPLLIRIPYGHVYGSLIRSMGRDGYRFVTWTLDTRDWEGGGGERTLEACASAVPGDIILIHSQATSPETLRAIIRLMRERGLSCITVSEMMGRPVPCACPATDTPQVMTLPVS